MSYLYPSALPSYRTPVSQNPREKYLAALAEAKAAEAEYLAAERLQREEDELRQRLEQIQSLKHQSTTSPAYFTQQQYPQAAPTYHQTAPLDLDAFRRQIAAEERARIVREQEQARELEAIRAHEVHNAQLEAQRKARELEAIRVHEVRKAQQAARDQERARALVAQRTELEGLTRRALNNTVRVVVGEDAAVPRRQHCRPQRAAYPEFRNTVDLTPLLAAAGKRQHQQAHEHNACNCAPKKETNELEDVFAQLFGSRVAVEAQQQPKQQPKRAPAPAQAGDLGQLIQHILGGAPVPAAPQPKPKAEPKPQQVPQQAPVTLEQLLNHFLGAAGIEVEVEQPKASASGAPKASASSSSQAQPSEKKEAAPAPQSAPAPAPASKPTPTPAPAAQPQHGGLEHILNHFLGAHPSAAAPNQHQVDLQQLMNMFLGGAAPHAQPEASSSKSSSESAPASKPAPTESVAQREARELEEAIRMSLAESHSTANTTESGKGKAPAPAPVKDVASSTAEVHAIDAEFNALSSEFVFPPTLDFSTSRTSSPSRALTGTTGDESAVARLSYSATNQPVRYYHQALSGLLTRLDAVDSFGDEGLRHTRKEVVGRVEGALDEVEKVVDARWRKFTGKAERSESAPIALPVESEAQPAPTVAEESPVAEEAPVVVTAEDVAPVDQDVPVELVVEAVPEATATPAVPEPAPEVESPSSYPPVADSESSYPPVTESSSSYPPSVAESVETLRPAASPAPSDIDTFLLPATIDEQPVKKPRVKDDVEEVGSDWSEVDA